MATAYEVLGILLPAGGWILRGDTFEGITWVGTLPRCTKEQFDAGFAQFDILKAEKEAQFLVDRASGEAKLLAVGLTKAEIKAIREDK